MPAFSHFFLKRLSARSKFSSSWIMTSDKFYFPPSWRLCAGMGQTDKLRRHNGMGQAKPSHSFAASASLSPATTHRRYVGGCPLRLRALARWLSEPSRRNQASVARRRRKRTDCRSWVVACEDTLRLPFEVRAGASAYVAPRSREGFARPACLRPLNGREQRRASAPRRWESARAETSALARRALRAVVVNEPRSQLQSVQGGEGAL